MFIDAENFPLLRCDCLPKKSFEFNGSDWLKLKLLSLIDEIRSVFEYCIWGHWNAVQIRASLQYPEGEDEDEVVGAFSREAKLPQQL